MMVAEDRYPDKKIAELVGISERTLENWKKAEKFKQRVAHLVNIYAENASVEAWRDVKGVLRCWRTFTTSCWT